MSHFSITGGLCLAASVSLCSSLARADQLLLIDISVTNQLTITATSGLSAVSVMGSDSIGVYLDGFFNTSGTLNETLVSGDLTNAENPSNNAPNLFRGVDPGEFGLNIFSWSPDVEVKFTAGSVAFTGSATWALTPAEYLTVLEGNHFGDLYFPADTHDDLGGAVLLGTWGVVPAPGAVSIAGVSMVFGAVRRRR